MIAGSEYKRRWWYLAADGSVVQSREMECTIGVCFFGNVIGK
jgi:hypothetical protein